MSRPADELYRRHRYSVEDYYRMAEAGIIKPDDRLELIEGEIIEMVPIGSRHAAVVTQLQHAFEQAMESLAVVRVQNPIRLSDLSEPEPDIAVLRWRDDFYAGAHPGPADILLLIEVADSTLRYDREIKLPLYARHGIGEGWLVDLENRKMLRFTRPAESGYADERAVDLSRPLTVPGLDDIRIDLSALF